MENEKTATRGIGSIVALGIGVVRLGVLFAFL